MVAFRKEAGERNKNDTDYRAIAKRLNNLRRHHSFRCRGSPRLCPAWKLSTSTFLVGHC